MKQYHEMLKHILTTGRLKEDRTGTGTLSVFGYQMRFDLADGFPLMTTKKVYWHGVVEELLWFLRGETNIKSLVEKNVHIWDAWADKDGELGRIYGHQWRKCGKMRWKRHDGAPLNSGTDQLANVISEIKTNPNSRRLMVSAWNVLEIEMMALPPCHFAYQFYVVDGKLSCRFMMRSTDAFLGLPFNISSYALLTHMVAQVCNLQVGELIFQAGDLHIYNNHIEQVMLQLSRDPKQLPTLQLDPSIKDIDGFRSEHIKLVGYDPYPAIRAEVAV